MSAVILFHLCISFHCGGLPENVYSLNIRSHFRADFLNTIFFFASKQDSLVHLFTDAHFLIRNHTAKLR